MNMKANNLFYFMRLLLWSNFYQVRSFFTYRLQSLIWFIYSGFTSLYALITITIIYNVSKGIAGWDYFQILALSSTITIFMNLIYTLVNPWSLVQEMRHGNLDTWLMRPYGIVTILLSTFGSFTSLAGVISGVAIFIYALYHVSFSVMSLFAFLLLFSLGSVAMVLFIVMLSILSYHLFRSANFTSKLLGVLSSAGSYPLVIYGPILAMVFTVALPIGIASYYPTETLFGRINPSLYLAIIFLEVVVTMVSYKAINVMMRHYTSGGG
jgi:ABC-type uncharacterized transport system permease subunit